MGCNFLPFLTAKGPSQWAVKDLHRELANQPYRIGQRPTAQRPQAPLSRKTKTWPVLEGKTIYTSELKQPMSGIRQPFRGNNTSKYRGTPTYAERHNVWANETNPLSGKREIENKHMA